MVVQCFLHIYKDTCKTAIAKNRSTLSFFAIHFVIVFLYFHVNICYKSSEKGKVLK